jgi:threonine dehydrogenase-like Zn-dependent dehydrogenase
MRAVRSDGSGVQIVDVPAQRAEAGNDRVRVRVRAAGICGSDLLMLEKSFLRPDVTIGHEFAGVLDDGREVAVQPTTPCGNCEFCARGAYQLCPSCIGSTLGVSRAGGMADEVWVDPVCIVPLAASLPVGDACLVEPLAVAVHGIERSGLVSGQRVAVVGGGTVGLLAAAVARARGCAVDLVARHAAQWRAAETLQVGREPSGLYDLVIDAAGSESAVARAVELARPEATLLMLGWDWQRVVLPGYAIAAKELVIRATVTYGHQSATRDVDAAAALLAAAPEIAQALITHRMPLDAAVHAFAVARDRAGGAIKVVLEP